MRAALDPLASKIKNAIETHFKVKVVNLFIHKPADEMWGILSNNFPSSNYTITLEVIQSKHKLGFGEYPAYTINHALKEKMFDKILDGNGRLMSMSTNMDNHGSKTTIDFITNDLVQFASAIEDFGWKAYAKEFDALMAEKLSDN